MEQFGITLYYTDNHPANGQPFFTEKELIEEAQDICNNQDDNEIIVTADEASAYLQEQGYRTFHWEGPTPYDEQFVLVYAEGWDTIEIDQWVSDDIGCPAFDTYYDVDTIYWANLPEPPKPF